MSEDLGTIYYDVDADMQPLLGKAAQLDGQLGDLQRGMQRTDRSAKQMQGGLNQTERSAGTLNTKLNGLTRTIRAVASALVLREMASWIQGYQEMSERVQMATSSQAEFEMVQRRLMDTANGTYRSLGEAQELYIRTADSLRSMGYATEQALDVQDSLSYSFVTNATSADRANTAISAFSKSMNTGRVAADQWETITSAIPTVINDIAAASGRSAAEVRELGASGRLTARDLSEGLRQALDANSEAASKMANNMTDAGVRAKTAFTAVLVELESKYGVLQSFTDGIIMAADAMLGLSQNATAMADVMTGVQLVATSLAAVIAGRLLTALHGSATALYASTIAAGAKAQASLTAAKAAAALAAQQLIEATTAERAAVGLSTHAAAARALTAAQANATASTLALSNAQAVVAGTATIATRAMAGLRLVMGFLGGPVGVVLLAAAAIYTFATRAREARQPTIALTEAVDDLSGAQRELATIEARRELQRLGDQADKTRTQIERGRQTLENSRGRYTAEREAIHTEALVRLQVELEATEDSIASYQKRLEDLAAPRSAQPATGEPDFALPEIVTTEDGQKRLEQMRQEIELAKLTGVARSRLQAIQRLGAEATDEERAEAVALATELYNLEEAQKRAEDGRKAMEQAQKDHAQSLEDATRAAQDNADVLADLQEALHQTTLTTEELVQRQAELRLNEYATEEQIEQVRALALMLNQAQVEADALEKRRGAFGDDPTAAITGDVDPLSGGRFDDQFARYAAEEEAERERYAAALERLREAKELEIEVIGGYQALELEMAQTHADRLAQIDQARTDMLLESGEAGFGAVADMMKTAFGEQSALYQAAFVAQKAFAVAQSIVAIQQGIAMAAANPWPLNLAAMASVAAATAGLVANISSVAMPSSGSRAIGGPVQPGQMYRVNEGGAPEMFTAANGNQFMIPNARGEVVSNRDAAGQGSRNVSINQTVVVQGKMDNYTQTQIARKTAERQRVDMSRFGG